MAAPRRRRIPRKPKKRVAVSLEPETLAWITAHVGPAKRFWSISHAVEQGIEALRARKG